MVMLLFIPEAYFKKKCLWLLSLCEMRLKGATDSVYTHVRVRTHSSRGVAVLNSDGNEHV